jgi:hypothetical protein
MEGNNLHKNNNHNKQRENRSDILYSKPLITSQISSSEILIYNIWWDHFKPLDHYIVVGEWLPDVVIQIVPSEGEPIVSPLS